MEPHYQLTKPSVLVVDDHPEQLKALFKKLQHSGYGLLTAQNGKEALELVALAQPDIILLDIKLSDMDGFEICRHLKQMDKVRDVPVIFTTNVNELAEKLEGFEAGGADYITKPFHLEEVLACVKTHLTVRKLQRDLEMEEERFRGLSNATFEGILFHDGGRIIEVNQTLEKLFSYSRNELLELEVSNLLTPECLSLVAELMVSEGERVYEAKGRRNDGKIIPLELQTRTILYHGQTLRVLALRDISCRKTIEKEAKRLESENIILKASLSDRDYLGELIGRGPAMQKLYERILKAAVSDAPVIIYGETGAGKELAARTIWQLNDKFKRIFIPVNCAALQEPLFESQFFGYRKGAFTGAIHDETGYFDQAHGGILFLDEISELYPAMQAKLLRVLNNGEYTPVGATKTRSANVRIIAATNHSLRPLVAAGGFREDLYHRLNVITLEIPPLRQHKEDLPLLVAHFLSRIEPGDETRRSLPDEILGKFMEYDWPGNVRELSNEVRRYAIMDEVELRSPWSEETGPERLSPCQPFNEQMAAFECHVIGNVLEGVNGNRARASELLKIPLPTLYRKIQKYGL